MDNETPKMDREATAKMKIQKHKSSGIARTENM